jgi:beta-lactamase class A
MCSKRGDAVRQIARKGLLGALLAGVCLSSTGQSTQCAGSGFDDAVTARLNKTVQAMVEERATAGKGKTAVFAVKLNDGSAVGVDEDVPVQTASVIKLGILYEAMVQVREGKAKWDEPIVLKKGDAVPGSGILTLLDVPLTITLKDALTLMVMVSDNTATNLMIDRFGIENVNARMESLGLKNTHLYKKVFKPAVGPMPADQPKFGLGKTTAREISILMTRIGTCGLRRAPLPVPPGPGIGVVVPMFVPPDEQDKAVCGVALDMLKHQFSRETIPRYLETADATTNGVAIASKTGSLDAVRNDVAIVMGRPSKDGGGPMVLAIFTYDNADHGWTVDNEGEVEIAKLAKVIVDAWSPDGLDGSLLVPGLGLGEDEKGCKVAKQR